MTTANNTSSNDTRTNVMHWFRKGLRLNDNPALMAALLKARAITTTTTTDGASACCSFYPVFVLDGDSYQLFRCTPLRVMFLLECLQDLDRNLRQLGSRLYVLKGDPTIVLPEKWREWNIGTVTFEDDESWEPYALQRDAQICKLAAKYNPKVSIQKFPSETLLPLEQYMIASRNNPPPNTCNGFRKLFDSLPKPKKPLAAPTKAMFPKPQRNTDSNNNNNNNNTQLYLPPKKPTDLPWPRSIPKSKAEPQWTASDCQQLHLMTPMVHGGEKLALKALAMALSDPDWVATFQKPDTSGIAIQPSTTCLSPYLSWGCLSPRQVWYAVEAAIEKASSNVTLSKPPQSLHGQLLWRDFAYLMALDANRKCPGSWNVMKGNKHCRQIPWEHDMVKLEAWKNGQTGYPWIDAAMRQLKREGWLHHLGRHAVACFLTRGNLWQSWEEGAKHFESHLLDADYALNGFNWLWVSCSGFFYKYPRCYSPISYQKKYDVSGKYIRKFCPELKGLPKKYIYTPWEAPPDVLKRAQIELGVTYPRPIVDHAVVSEMNKSRVKSAYQQYDTSKDGNPRVQTDSSRKSARNEGGTSVTERQKQDKKRGSRRGQPRNSKANLNPPGNAASFLMQQSQNSSQRQQSQHNGYI